MTYCEGLNLETFEKTGLNYDVTVRNLVLIGEVANHVPALIREENVFAPWRQIIATRNRLIHGYLGIDNVTLWSIIPSSIVELQKIVQKSSADQN